MRYLSLFSGIEAASVAAKGLNWTPVAFSEIAEFPSAVLKNHFPKVPNLGDVKNIDGVKYHGTVDLVVGGSPCQDFSIAGKRTGLHGNRSSLAWEYVRLLDEARPRWFLWENVPGVLSSNKGDDFSKLIFKIQELGYGVCWRVLDAQYFGVPQRRCRIFLVGYFGDWRPPAAVLFEQKSLSGDNQTCRKKQRGTSDNIETCSFPTMLDKICPTILASAGKKQFLGNQEAFGGKYFVFDFFCTQSYANIIHSSVASTLKATGGSYAGGSENFVIQNMIVRKLSPLECERLQGFPDNYTDIPYKGKSHSPLSKRYEALGNAIAVPVLRWIFYRINEVQGLQKNI